MVLECNPGPIPPGRAAPERGFWRDPSWTALMLLGLLSRGAILLLGYCLARPAGDHPSPGAFTAAVHDMYVAHHNQMMSGSARRIEPWYRWDAVFYAEIAQHGYTYRPDHRSTVAFFPLLPLLMAAGAALGGTIYWTGLILPNLAFALGLALWGRVLLRVTGDGATTWRACLLLVAYPWSFFFAAPYQESLGFLLTAAALWAWLNRRSVPAALALGGATAARVGAIALSVGILAEWASDLIHRRRVRPWAWLVAAGGGVGVGGFYGYLAYRFGDPLLQLKVQADWGRQPARLAHVGEVLGALVRSCQESDQVALTLGALLLGLAHRPLGTLLVRGGGRLGRWVTQHPGWLDLGGANVLLGAFFLVGGTLMDQADLGTMGSFLIFGMHAWWKRGPLWGTLVLLPVVLPMATGSTMSMARLVLAAYPGFLDAAELAPRGRLSFAILLTAGLMAQAVLIQRHVNWGFTG